MDKILYGCAYYDEYMPEERLEQDMKMMESAGINVIRIAESTWSSEEISEGVFDFSHVTRVIEMAEKYGIDVIVGTPTYAIPAWLAYKYPDILATTEDGHEKYGRRQNMDMTNPHYLFYVEGIVRKLVKAVVNYKNVIGFQLDNETKHYHTAGPNVQKLFVSYLKKEFGTIDRLNEEFGFAYWSNRVDCWEHIPDVTGSINASFLAEFEKFRRMLVSEFLLWQRKIIDDYRRDDQFVTHNFDFSWKDYSYGVQPEVNHFQASDALTIAGCDIYHPTQDDLTGKEIAFCGAITRGLKDQNYLVLETQAQGLVTWTPYDGQLKLQAFSHLANGANSVMYWHWHSIHNAIETYWRGILGHDMQENRVYRQIKSIGLDLQKVGKKLVNLKKRNHVALLISNESLTALEKSPMFPLPDGLTTYNDIVRRYADALYELNIEYDIISSSKRDFSKYDVVIAPALYSAEEDLLLALQNYVKKGGYLLVTFKSAYANEYLTVYHDEKPHILQECLGVYYQEYTLPKNVTLKAAEKWIPEPVALLPEEDREALAWMEFIMPKKATVLASYDHPFWGSYAAITENTFGDGKAMYVGCFTTLNYTIELLSYVMRETHLQEEEQRVRYPIVIKSGINDDGNAIHYYFNFSPKIRMQKYLHENAVELLSDQRISKGESITLYPWDVYIFEEIMPHVEG